MLSNAETHMSYVWTTNLSSQGNLMVACITCLANQVPNHVNSLEKDTANFPVITMPDAFPGHSEPCCQVQLVNVWISSAHPFTFL